MLSWKPVNDPRCETYRIVTRHSCEQESRVERILYETTELSRNISSSFLRIPDGDDNKRSDLSIKAMTSDGFLCNETDTVIRVENSGKHQSQYYLFIIIYAYSHYNQCSDYYKIKLFLPSIKDIFIYYIIKFDTLSRHPS